MKRLEVFGVVLNIDSLGHISTTDRVVRQWNGHAFCERLYPAKLLTPVSNGKAGYYQVTLTRDGKSKKHYVHRLVWQAFHGEIPEGYEVDHKDNDKANNRIDNLQLLTRADNMRKCLASNPHLKYNLVQYAV